MHKPPFHILYSVRLWPELQEDTNHQDEVIIYWGKKCHQIMMMMTYVYRPLPGTSTPQKHHALHYCNNLIYCIVTQFFVKILCTKIMVSCMVYYLKYCTKGVFVAKPLEETWLT